MAIQWADEVINSHVKDAPFADVSFLRTLAVALGPRYLSVMLRAIGVIEARETWKGRAHRILCEKINWR